MDLGEFIRSKGYYEVRIYSGYYVGRKPRLNIQVPGDKNRKLKPTFFQRTGYIGPALSSAAICLIQDESDGLAQTLNGIDLKRKSIEVQAGKTI